jgi:hypothetical protein
LFRFSTFCEVTARVRSGHKSFRSQPLKLLAEDRLEVVLRALVATRDFLSGLPYVTDASLLSDCALVRLQRILKLGNLGHVRTAGGVLLAALRLPDVLAQLVQ